MPRYDFEIGTSLEAMTNLESLGVPIIPPKSFFTPVTEVVTLGDGSTRGVGTPTASWHWGFIKQDQRDMLRTFCPEPDVSATVYIRTYTREMDGYASDAPQYFQAVMHWPVLEEEVDAGRRLDFKIDFTQLILQEEPA
jgi:hypothetical protein